LALRINVSHSFIGDKIGQQKELKYVATIVVDLCHEGSVQAKARRPKISLRVNPVPARYLAQENRPGMNELLKNSSCPFWVHVSIFNRIIVITKKVFILQIENFLTMCFRLLIFVVLYVQTATKSTLVSYLAANYWFYINKISTILHA